MEGSRAALAEHIRPKLSECIPVLSPSCHQPSGPSGTAGSGRNTAENGNSEFLQKFQAVPKPEEIHVGHDPAGILGKQELLSQVCVITTSEFISFALLRIEAAPKLPHIIPCEIWAHVTDISQ